MPLRDLREDLNHRLRLIQIERSQIESRLEVLAETEAHVKSLLAFEEMRIRSEERNLALPFMVSAQMNTDTETTAFRTFLLDLLSDGIAWTLDEMKHRAVESGLDFGNKRPGRVLHFVLLGLAQQGQVEMVSKGIWRKLGEREKVPIAV